MLVPREWHNEPQIFDFVSDALLCSESEDYEVIARDERDSYGNLGYIIITDAGGRRFSLTLNEEL